MAARQRGLTEELVDGDSSGDTEDTYVTYVMR